MLSLLQKGELPLRSPSAWCVSAAQPPLAFSGSSLSVQTRGRHRFHLRHTLVIVLPGKRFFSWLGYKYVCYSLKKRDISLSLCRMQSVWAWGAGIKSTSSSLTGLAVCTTISICADFLATIRPPYSRRPVTEPAYQQELKSTLVNDCTAWTSDYVILESVKIPWSHEKHCIVQLAALYTNNRGCFTMPGLAVK